MNWTITRSIAGWFGVASAIMVAIGVATFVSIAGLMRDNETVDQSHQTIELLQATLSSLKDAETGQRGYLLTGREYYLSPFNMAEVHLPQYLQQLRVAFGDNPTQLQRLDQLSPLIAEKIKEMGQTIELRRSGGLNSALALVVSDHGYIWMTKVRILERAMQDDTQEEANRSKVHLQQQADRTLLAVGLGLGLNLLILPVVYWLVSREISQRKLVEVAMRETNGRLFEAQDDLKTQVNELEQRTRQMIAVAEMGELLQTCRTFEEAYEVIAKSMQQLCPGSSGSLNIISSSNNLVEAVVAWGNSSAGNPIFLPDDCWALRRSRMHAVTDRNTDLLCRHLEGELPFNYICVPLLADRVTLGVLHVVGADNLSEAVDHRMARAAAEHITLTLSNLRLQETLRQQSIRDPLTGLFNRRYLEVSLERELVRAQRDHRSIGIIMLDIDHFKTFNDNHGHDAGDALLREVGKFLQDQVRGGDIACRYGGEEFILIFPDASLADCQTRAEAIRERIKDLVVLYRGQSLGRVCLSLGVSGYPQHGDELERLVRAADAALYRAKRAGRDRVVLAA